MDFYGVRPRLVWANEREVEPEFQTTGETRGDTDTAVWFIEKGAVTLTYENAVTEAKEGEWVFLRAENGRQRFEPGSRVISMRFHLRLRGGESLYAPRQDRARWLGEYDGSDRGLTREGFPNAHPASSRL